jgi:predicted ester cyclase
MSTEENKAIIRRFYAEIDKGNLAALDELVVDDYVNHAPPPFPGLAEGREGLKQAFNIFWKATPGYHQIEDMIAEGDKVVTRLTAYGKHAGDMFGIQATDNDLEMKAVAIHRVVDGQIVEHWSCKDELGFLQQLGVIPRSEPAAPPGG